MKQSRKEHYSGLKKFYQKEYWDSDPGNNLNIANGFKSFPELQYRAFSEEIDKDGNVLDLGCGNGLMLKYLMITSGHKLVPFGIDFMPNSIKQAKNIVHPQYKNNFILGNFVDLPFKKNWFDFIFSPIHHVYSGDRKLYLEKIKTLCKPDGKIIFYEYADVLKNENYEWVGNFPELKQWDLQRKDYQNLSLGIWKKQ